VNAATTDPREEHAMTQQQRRRNTALEKLSDTGLSLADSSQDIRNRKVIDRLGEEIGHVSGLFIDQDERKVRMLEIRAGGFLGIGDRHVILPVDAITSVTKDEVHVNQTGERVAHSPAYDPTLIVDTPAQDFWEPYYGYYGLSPYWGAGYMYPEFPSSRERPITD
jgi:sporulation protein YlmC with PRC-barrel domain